MPRPFWRHKKETTSRPRYDRVRGLELMCDPFAGVTVSNLRAMMEIFPCDRMSKAHNHWIEMILKLHEY